MALESSGLRMVPFAVSKSMDGTGQLHVEYPQLNFAPESLFALGSPIGMFLSVRCVWFATNEGSAVCVGDLRLRGLRIVGS